MADTSQMFARLLPIDIKFFNGESPSPQKMNGIFNYVHAAFYILESFLGNGIDYRMPIGDPKNRKMLFNVSQVLGNTGKLYKPVNTLVMNEYINRNFGIVNQNLGPIDALHASHTTYQADIDTLFIRDNINIPICIETKGDAYYLGIYYTGAGSISIHGGEIDESQVLDLKMTSFRKFFFFSPTMNYIDYITLAPHKDMYGNSTQFHIESIYLSKASDTSGETERIFSLDGYGNPTSEYVDVLHDYNTAYAIPLDNGDPERPTFWTIKSPCRWATENVCTRKTCSYCIGNIYDIDVDNGNTPIGAPICGGLENVYGTIDYKLIPVANKTDNNLGITHGRRLQYEKTNYSANSQSQIYTIQSPVLMTAKPYMMKYRPFRAHNLGAGTALTKNESVVYDLSSRTNPVRYNVPIYSAGRPDIVYALDTNKELVAGSSTDIQILGGPYTMTEFIEDLIMAINVERNPQVAIYAD